MKSSFRTLFSSYNRNFLDLFSFFVSFFCPLSVLAQGWCNLRKSGDSSETTHLCVRACVRVCSRVSLTSPAPAPLLWGGQQPLTPISLKPNPHFQTLSFVSLHRCCHGDSLFTAVAEALHASHTAFYCVASAIVI